MTTLAAILRQAKALLLDFDGPVCRVFGGMSAPAVAAELRTYMASQGVMAPTELDRNPLKLLEWTGSHHPEQAHNADDHLTALETLAVESATPTEHAHSTIVKAHNRGMCVVVVSNNSKHAIERYLALQGLTPSVTMVIGRAYGEPERLKPHPYSVQRAIEELGTYPAACALVGDSTADIAAARASGVISIGFAKTPERTPALADAGAAVIIDSMGELAAELD